MFRFSAHQRPGVSLRRFKVAHLHFQQGPLKQLAGVVAFVLDRPVIGNQRRFIIRFTGKNLGFQAPGITAFTVDGENPFYHSQRPVGVLATVQ